MNQPGDRDKRVDGANAMLREVFNNERDARSFSEIRDSLKGLPMTWYPALLATVIEESIKAGSFLNIFRFVENVVSKIDPKLLSLRFLR